jgi:ABC-type transport system involved in multi-copper enzyme maturation permease subunit
VSLLVEVAGLALRELWISFRLLPAVGALLLSGLPAALLPHVAASDLAGAPPSTLTWFALALALGMALVAAIAAGTFAAERRRGTAAWVSLRAVPRATILLAWFAAFVLLVLIGSLPAALVAWVSLDVIVAAQPAPYAAAVAAALSAGLLALAAGLLAGTLLSPRVAAVTTLILSGAALVGSVAAAAGASPQVPVGLGLLAGLDELASPLADGLRSAGLTLALTAVLLILAATALDRVDL